MLALSPASSSSSSVDPLASLSSVPVAPALPTRERVAKADLANGLGFLALLPLDGPAVVTDEAIDAVDLAKPPLSSLPVPPPPVGPGTPGPGMPLPLTLEGTEDRTEEAVEAALSVLTLIGCWMPVAVTDDWFPLSVRLLPAAAGSPPAANEEGGVGWRRPEPLEAMDVELPR